jgi:hypothetical protein
MSEPTVRIYDPETDTLTTIPARELAPGVIRAQLTGVEGDVWIEPTRWREPEYQHPPFPDDIRKNYLERFQATFADVYPRTVEEWEDGFRRDAHPNQEIAIWVCIANVFEHFTAGRDLSAEQRQDIFHTVLACANNGKDYVLFTTNPRTLSKKRVREIVDYFFAKRQ